MGTEKRDLRADTLNLLVITGVLILVAAVTVLGLRFCDKGETEREMNRAESLPAAFSTYEVYGVREGPLATPTGGNPWRREEVGARAAQMVPACSFFGKEEPYDVAKPDLFAHPEALAALREMAREMPAAAGVCLSLDAGYCTWEAAGNAAGQSLFHTGYALQISFSVLGEGTVPFEEAERHPLAASPAAWLRLKLADYGFVWQGAGNGGIYYVGVPHAAVMAAEGISDIASYTTFLRAYTQEAPYTITDAGGAMTLFYVAAARGGATVTVGASAVFRACGNGEDGFAVAVYLPRT